MEEITKNENEQLTHFRESVSHNEIENNRIWTRIWKPPYVRKYGHKAMIGKVSTLYSSILKKYALMSKAFLDGTVRIWRFQFKKKKNWIIKDNKGTVPNSSLLEFYWYVEDNHTWFVIWRILKKIGFLIFFSFLRYFLLSLIFQSLRIR